MKTTRPHLRCAVIAALSLTGLYGTAADALTIVLNDVGATPMTATQLAAFNAAAQRWENTFTDPITVNLNVSMASLDEGILGSTASGRTTHSYSSVRAAMLADASTTTETNAVSGLSAGTTYPLTDVNGTRNEPDITMTTANAKALGLGTGLDSLYALSNPPVGVDGEIQFSTNFAWDYDPSDGIDSDKTDFIAVAAHEIGHALGFVSATDIQDGNPTFTLSAATLDLWRFEETGAGHALATEPRLLTAGDAEYYDSVRSIPLSHGMDVFDSLCNTWNQRCQASHWSDDQSNLMDPTLAQGVAEDIQSDDRIGLDFIGYNSNFICLPCIYIPIYYIEIWWWWPWEWQIPDVIGPIANDFPIPEWRGEVPEWANMAMAMGMDLGELGLRGGIGFARFDEGGPVRTEALPPMPFERGVQNLFPPGEPMKEMPPAITDMTFVSDDHGGKPFTFEATCGSNGCLYDRTLGEAGGYRIPGFIDAEGDGVEGDVDGRLTLLLLLPSDNPLPDPEGGESYKVDPSVEDNSLVLNDPEAFGLEPQQADTDGDGVPDDRDNCLREPNADQRDTDRDGIGNACDADIAQPNDCEVGFSDLNELKVAFLTEGNDAEPGRDGWNPDADLDGDGQVGFTDLNRLKLAFFQKPGPSGTPNECR